MSRLVRYLSHPQVQIDPEIPIQNWSLSKLGQSRVAALAKSGALAGTTKVISSAETKALETARPLAVALGCEVEVRARMHENDRSATGFLPPAEFEEVADAFFANPEQSVRGWETAAAAQTRIVAEVEQCQAEHAAGDLLFVGHGAVGTLLYCHLSGLAISRAYDQGPGGGGCYFEYDAEQRVPHACWRPLEQLITG
ncbi:phosphoglycerate mutase [Roseobacter cerasinus]|uniref:Phosphoglycerate mutase n=1 Tax=Roseobacter cerasinus TaxID=2602289 RepID=A0A640VT55_9RHOB|nr:histidine phosphatase family protein [Roseobacter cerasinus]GFE49406.1 phosphoglycerate mutase [Roseobacter cerasinus]